MKVLVIDDKPQDIDIISSVLESLNCVYKSVNNPKKAIDTYIKEDFDIVIIDIRMLGMNKINVVNVIKTLDSYAKFIFVSSNSMDEIKSNTLNTYGYPLLLKTNNSKTFKKNLYNTILDFKEIKKIV